MKNSLITELEFNLSVGQGINGLESRLLTDPKVHVMLDFLSGHRLRNPCFLCA